jgi:2-polyprenyl-6-hydroxyphenyl methylase/3-demethylubiquinone-9 3-methyltransferase
MEPLRDPEGFEVKNLILASQITGKEVLEIGCGGGWLTWQYAGIVEKVFGIDPSFPDLQKARASQPARVTNVSLIQSKGEALPFPPGVFDSVVFSSSF